MKSNAPIADFRLLHPSDTQWDATWTKARKDAVLTSIRTQIAAAQQDGATPTRETTAAGPRLTRRRALTVTGLVAAAAVALLAVPLLLPAGGPGGPGSAIALEALARTAAAEPVLAAGQFRHIVTNDSQTGLALRTLESWTAPDGQMWRRDSVAGTVSYFTAQLEDPSPQSIETLPTDPDELAAYLRATVTGSASTDEAVFVAVGDLLRGGFAPPALRSAALTMLKAAPHVTATHTTDKQGGPAIAVTFEDQSVREGVTQTLYFDPATARVVQERTTAPDLLFESVVSVDDVVDAVPADVREHATGNGTCTIDGAVTKADACAAPYLEGAATSAATSETPPSTELAPSTTRDN